MSAAALTLDASRALDAPGSRVLEWLAIGGITFVLFPLAWALRAALGLDEAELAVGFVCFHAAHFINDPHFSVTYLLFYDAVPRDVSASQRARWIVAGVIVPVALLSWGARALWTHDAQSIGWMAQLMYLLVGWHYAKQGFGVLTVIGARRGTFFTSRERTALLAHVYAAWAFAWASPASVAGEFEEKGVVYWAPARPGWLETVTGVVLAVTSIALAVLLALRWRRERTLPWAELACFLATIWFWTIATSLDPLVRYVIPALHSIQYLYFVWLAKRTEARALEGPPTFGPRASTRVALLAVSAVVLGWVLFHGGPDAFDSFFVERSPEAARGAMGATPFFAVAYLFVNTHHYFMDWALWRRESATAKWLVVRE